MRFFLDCLCVSKHDAAYDGTLCEPCVARLVAVAGEPENDQPLDVVFAPFKGALADAVRDRSAETYGGYRVDGWDGTQCGLSTTASLPCTLPKNHEGHHAASVVQNAVVEDVQVFRMLEPSVDCVCGNHYYESIGSCPACGRPTWSES